MFAVRRSDTNHCLNIFTDSQASIHLIYRALHSPHTLLECKHRHLLLDLADYITSRAMAGVQTRIYKVKAHSGVVGNEKADVAAGKLARGEAPPDAILDTDNESTLQLPCWPVVQVPAPQPDMPPRVWAVSNLTTALTLHTLPHHSVGLSKQTTATAVRAIINQHAHPHASNHMWSSSLPYGAIRVALLVRFNQLHCSARAHRMGLPYRCSGPFPAAGPLPLSRCS